MSYAGIGNFVYIGDIDHAVTVFVKLGHLCDLWFGHWYERLIDHSVQGKDVLHGLWC